METALLDDEQADTRCVANPNHRVGMVEPKCHRLFDKHMLARSCASETMVVMKTARRQNTSDVNVVASEQILKVSEPRNLKSLTECLCAFRHDIADGTEDRAVDLAARKEVGMSPSNVATPYQAELQHAAQA